MIEFLKRKKIGKGALFMAMLQGNTYELPIRVTDCGGKVIDDTMVQGGSFSIGEIEKKYGEVWFDNERKCWIIPLSESETMGLSKSTKWQARFLLNNGQVVGTLPKTEYVYESINKVQLSGVSEDVGE